MLFFKISCKNLIKYYNILTHQINCNKIGGKIVL